MQYLSYYGRHISKPLYEWAVSQMEKKDGSRIKPQDKESVKERMKTFGVVVKNDKAYDIPYVWAMGSADYLGSSIPDEIHLAKFVADYLDDPDGSKTRAFDELYAKTLAIDMPLVWEELL